MTPTKQQAQAALDDLFHAEYREPGNGFGSGHYCCEIPEPYFQVIRQALQSIIDAPETITRGSGDVFKDLGIEWK